MKTAVIIAGQLRTIDKCLPAFKWQVMRHYPDADFYISASNDEDAPKAGLVKAAFPGARVEIEVVDQPDIPIPPGEPWKHAPYDISVPPIGVLRQLWAMDRAWRFYDGCLHLSEEVDRFIRWRADTWISSFSPVSVMGEKDAHVPWWGSFGGINDRFAVLTAHAAPHYFRTFSKLKNLIASGCPMHPESLVAASLEDGACYIRRTLKTEFSTLRKNGERRFPEITAWDIAHAGMR